MNYKIIPKKIREKIIKEYIQYQICTKCKSKSVYFTNSCKYIQNKTYCYKCYKKNIYFKNFNIIKYLHHHTLIARKIDGYFNIKIYPN